MKKLVKGNEAVVIGALVAGCDAFFGYPITPASEISHKASEYFLPLNKVFLQAESEIGAINMVFGASSCGRRVMTASSGPGISLKTEGISYLAGAELPAVIVNIMRVGPGLGNIGPEQSDYFQMVKGGGHGNYKVITFAPNSVNEIFSFTIKAFEIADKYRNPVAILADGTLGQMMEPIEIKPLEIHPPEKPWQVDPTPASNDRIITSIYLDFDDMEQYIRTVEKKYRQVEEQETMVECYRIDDAEYIFTGFGIVSRVLKSVVDKLRNNGTKAGMIRPQTLWPFPRKTFEEAAKKGKKFFVVELSTGQYVEDVRLSIGNQPLYFYSRVGGNLPSRQEIIEEFYSQVKE